VRDCLQWLTGTSGDFASFNFDTSSSTVSLTGTHLQHQYYDICWRRERGYCSLCFSTKIVGAVDTASSFGVSASASATIFQSNADSLCSFAPTTNLLLVVTNSLGPALTDYISVVNLQASIGTANTAGVSRICGAIFAGVAGETATATACTWSSPFKWGVHFDGGELISNPAADASAGQAQENATPTDLTAGQGQGFTGFYMSYWQNKC